MHQVIKNFLEHGIGEWEKIAQKPFYLGLISFFLLKENLNESLCTFLRKEKHKI